MNAPLTDKQIVHTIATFMGEYEKHKHECVSLVFFHERWVLAGSGGSPHDDRYYELAYLTSWDAIVPVLRELEERDPATARKLSEYIGPRWFVNKPKTIARVIAEFLTPPENPRTE